MSLWRWVLYRLKMRRFDRSKCERCDGSGRIALISVHLPNASVPCDDCWGSGMRLKDNR